MGNNMFAYCENNPVNAADHTGHMSSNLFSYTCFNGGGSPPYITDQDNQAIAHKRFGLTTVSHGGCGPIATYNALISLGNPKRFKDVLDYYNQHILQLNVAGFAGTPTDLVAQYFTDAGYNVIVARGSALVDALSKHADACILWTLFPATYHPLGFDVRAVGAHFVEYSKTSGGYTGRNIGRSGTYSFATPSDYACMEPNMYSIGIFIYK